MTKPRQTRPENTQKAPRAPKPAAPFARPPGNPPRPDPVERRVAQPKVSAGKHVPHPAPPAHTALGAIVNRRAANRLRNGHVWVYASDIESIQFPGGPAASPPSLIPVADSRGLLLGTALYSPTSQIALRIVSRESIHEPAWLQLLETRLRAAIARRQPLLGDQTDSCRLCFSEADELPAW